jgi:hypothetical protein
MLRKSLLGGLVLVLVTLIWVGTTVSGGAPPPLPTVKIPEVPSKPCCLFRFEKEAAGERTFEKPQLASNCPGGKGTEQWATKIVLRLAPGNKPCDETAAFVPNGSVVEAEGVTIHRGDGVAHFHSLKLILRKPNGQVLSVNGCMELLDKVNTRHPPFGQEPCNTKDHVEGWLVASWTEGVAGEPKGKADTFTLRAQIVGTSPTPAEMRAGTVGFKASIDGVVLEFH